MTVEYRAVDEKHNRPYTVEVDFMEQNEMRDVLWDHLQNIRQYYFKVEQPREVAHSRVEDSDDSENEDAEASADDEDKLTRKELVKLERGKRSADLILEALFKGDAKLDKEFLVRSGSAEAEDEILDTLLQIATDGLLDRPGGPDAVRYAEACPDLGSCKDLLDLLTTNPRGDEPAIWPFVKLIRFDNARPLPLCWMNYSLTLLRVYLDAPILKTGLVLADMPGMHVASHTHQSDTLLTLGLSRPQGHELCPTSSNREVHQKTLPRTRICDQNDSMHVGRDNRRSQLENMDRSTGNCCCYQVGGELYILLSTKC